MAIEKDINCKRNSSLNKIWGILFLLFCLWIFGAKVIYAYFYQVSKLENEFEIGKVEMSIEEMFNADKTTKSNVVMTNKGTIPVYLRAFVMIYWEDKDGKILLDTPVEGIDYIWIGSEEDDWIKEEDGFWYYTKELGVGKQTSPLIKECTEVKRYEDNRVLIVDIAMQSIQASPHAVIEDAWGVKVNMVGNIVVHLDNEVT